MELYNDTGTTHAFDSFLSRNNNKKCMWFRIVTLFCYLNQSCSRSALRLLPPMQARRGQVPGQERLQAGVHALLGRLPPAPPPLAQGARHRASAPRPARPTAPARRRVGGPQHEQLRRRLQGLAVAVVGLRLQWPPPWWRRHGEQVLQVGVVVIVVGAGEEEGQASAVPAPEEGQLQGGARHEDKP